MKPEHTMGFDQSIARANAAETAYPKDGNHASKWIPGDARPRQVQVRIAAPDMWTLEAAAHAIGVETPTEYTGDGEWFDVAACKGVEPEVFFPERGASPQSYAAVRAVCAGCAVAAQCLLFAMRGREQFGVWGGVSERQRRVLRIGRRVEFGLSPLGGRPLQPITHGTAKGYQQHRRRGEGACRACREAHSAVGAARVELRLVRSAG